MRPTLKEFLQSRAGCKRMVSISFKAIDTWNAALHVRVLTRSKITESVHCVLQASNHQDSLLIHLTLRQWFSCIRNNSATLEAVVSASKGSFMTTKTLDQHIETRPDIAGGKPRIAGHRITVCDIVMWHERLGKSVDEIAVANGSGNRTRAEVPNGMGADEARHRGH